MINLTRENKILCFEYDKEPFHTSKKVKILINNIFGEYIQNVPHSPDNAYLIETL